MNFANTLFIFTANCFGPSAKIQKNSHFQTLAVQYGYLCTIMKKTTAILASVILVAACTGRKADERQDIQDIQASAPKYETYFTDSRLRIDLTLAGNSSEQHAYLDGLACEAMWAGTHNDMLDPFGYGEYRYRAFAKDGTLIFERGLCPLFQEWRTTDEATRVDRSMPQTVWMPFPKDSIRVLVEARNSRTKVFEPLLEFGIDPQDKLIQQVPLSMPDTLQYAGPIREKVDILFVPEGYTASELDQFRAHATRFMEYLFQYEPYKSRRRDFNLWLLDIPSQESGVDIPHHDVWRNTLCQSGFYTFYIDRYLTIQDHSTLARAVAGAPFDALFIIANDEKYGGGGFYNSYAMGTASHKLSNEVFIHEFGHSFAGLGDEYYDSEVAYSSDYYPAGIEPWEPNITTLVDFSSKWQDMLDSNDILPNDSTQMNKLGLFEGAGYQTYGIYRPYFECRMKNNTAPAFCPVCQRAISRMIDFYTR